MAGVKIGLEIHGYIDSKSKLFCGCSTESSEPNTNICPVCTSQPGSKPMLPSSDALDKVLLISKMLGCALNKRLLFQRKHYSWPDLPSGYQRTISGSYSFPVGVDGDFLGIGIIDVHLEEDPARWDPLTGFVDYNRSGLPLVEIVTAPEFESPEQVKDWLRKMITTLSYIKAIDKSMGVKCDVNVSIGPKFNRVEVKNVNSFSSIVACIEHEFKRQLALQSKGKEVERETRAWSDEESITIFMRKKEEAMDYMFIPEPDLPVIMITAEHEKRISQLLPEKPAEKLKRYISVGIDKTDSEIISSDILLAEMLDKVLGFVDPILAARWLRKEIPRIASYNKKEIDELDFNSNEVKKVLLLVQEKKISDDTARKLLEKLAVSQFDVILEINDQNLLMISDEDSLERLCHDAISENPSAVADFRKGEGKSLNFLVGKVIAKTKGRADARLVREMITKILS